ncbi:YheC/YheD family protein [Paenibacillus sp. SC116]|uniref:YheC/YheD family protein n=1 Tax=Paenibacillus sp. SC116 TaxID=2968986 RepID=UPI00215B04C8|nr:YheC/YheD family protein [Paenibacillus sp. SC116]MCR8845221.1 YheC/YheD family protein [Paenibacillus sp. SC116]
MASKKRRVPSKWVKTAVLVRNKRVRRAIPQTMLYRASTLDKLLRRHGMVYVKPDHGQQGRGVMRVQQNNSKGTSFSVQRGDRIHSRLTWRQLVRELRPYTRNHVHVVQQGVDLLRYNGRILDIRAVTQVDRSWKWHFTGMVARIAQPRKAVTNGSQGADITPVPFVITRNGRSIETYNRIEAEIRQLCLLSARVLSRKYPFLQELGFDIGLDQKLRPWIIEVNTKPDVKPFSKISDHTMYYRILRYRRNFK